MLFEQLLTTYSKKWEDWNNTREYIQWLDSFLSDLASKKQTILEKQQIVINEEERLQQKFDTIAIQLKSIKDRETQNEHFTSMQILNGQLRKLFNQRNGLIDELAILEETENIKKSEIVNNTIVFNRLKKELVTLKEEIKEAGFLKGSINQLNKSMKTLQDELIQYELKQEESEKELQSLENLIKLVEQKLAIEAKLQKLENDKGQLKIAIIINNKTINGILDDKKSPKYKLIDNINELTLNNQKLVNDTHEQKNLIFALEPV